MRSSACSNGPSRPTTCARSQCSDRPAGSRTPYQSQLRLWRRRQHGLPARRTLRNRPIARRDTSCTRRANWSAGASSHAGARSETRLAVADRDQPHEYGQHNDAIKLLTWRIGGFEQRSAPQLALDRNRSDVRCSDARPDLPQRPTHALRQTSQTGQTLPQSQTARPYPG